MQLTYTLQGLSQTLAIAGDDIPALLRSAEHQLQVQHPELPRIRTCRSASPMACSIAWRKTPRLFGWVSWTP